MMECPVCYCEDAKCTLVCGHSFCHGCVKNWWTKSEECATCPMCRQSLYFRGIRDHVAKWDSEKIEFRNQSVYNRIFDEIMEDLDEEDIDDFDRSLAMFSLMNLEDVYGRVNAMNWDVDEDTMYDILHQYMLQMTWSYEPIVYDDIMPHEKLLFVPKKQSAVERLHTYATNREHKDKSLGIEVMYVTIIV